MESRSGRRIGQERPRGATGRLCSQPQRGAHGRLQPRRGAAGDGDGVDRISSLPEDVRLEILVRLRCTRAAARTTVLSSQWRGLWRQLRDLRFRNITPAALAAALAKVACPELPLLDMTPEALDAALARVDCPELSRLHIKVSGDLLHSGVGVASLLRAVSRLAPLDLIVTVDRYVFTESVEVKIVDVEVPCFHRAKSIKLHLQDSLRHPLVLADEFPMLERLFITGCCFSMDHLISRCPRLRVLEVHNSNLGDTVKVRSTTIVEVTVHNVHGIDIEAPALRKLTIVDLYASDLILLCPCLRVLRVCNLQPNEIYRIHSTTIEELVVDTGLYGSMQGIFITAPLLKKFTLNARLNKNFSMSFSAPVVENLLWHCRFDQEDVGFYRMWWLSSLNLWMENSAYILNLHICLPLPMTSSLFPRNFQEVVPLPQISVLELHIYSDRHVFGAMVLNLLGYFTAIRRLKLIIHRESSAKDCPSNCSCDRPQDWRSQIISLPALKVVEVANFQGSGHEVDFLKLLFRCSTLMKRVTVKLSPFTIHRGCKSMYNIFKANHSVKCFVYDSFGKKVMFFEQIMAGVPPFH